MIDLRLENEAIERQYDPDPNKVEENNRWLHDNHSRYCESGRSGLAEYEDCSCGSWIRSFYGGSI